MGDERGEYDTDSGEEEEGECGDSTEEEEEREHEEDDGGHDEDSCDPNGLFDALAAAQEAAER